MKYQNDDNVNNKGSAWHVFHIKIGKYKYCSHALKIPTFTVFKSYFSFTLYFL